MEHNSNVKQYIYHVYMLLSSSFIYNKSQIIAFSIAYFRSRNFQADLRKKVTACHVAIESLVLEMEFSFI